MVISNRGNSDVPPKMLQISRDMYHTMVAQMEAAFPLEGCGMMGGRGGRVARLYPVDNLLASPIAYEMEPLQQLEAMMDIEDRGLELLAIYHSHPHGPERPSPMDVAQAYYPDSATIIVSLRDRQHPVARAFTIVDGMVTEIPLQIV